MQRLIFVMAALTLTLALASARFGDFGIVSQSQAAAPSVDLNKVFRCEATDKPGTEACARARELIINNCTGCHTFVPIVMQGFDANGWASLLERHTAGARVNELGAQDIKVIHDYLTANFNGKLPPPDLPADLLKTWTSY